MKPISHLTVFFIFFICFSCKEASESPPMCITCKVSVHYDNPYRILISYNDTIETVYGDWTKEICFPSTAAASVMVIQHDRTHAYWDDPSLQEDNAFRENYYYRRPLLTVTLTTPTDTVISRGHQAVYAYIPYKNL